MPANAKETNTDYPIQLNQAALLPLCCYNVNYFHGLLFAVAGCVIDLGTS